MSQDTNGITPISVAQTVLQESQAGKESYLNRILIAFDQFINVIFNGHPDETISARSARAAFEGKLWGKIMSEFLDLFQEDHGAKAVAGDEERALIVEHLETSSKIINQ